MKKHKNIVLLIALVIAIGLSLIKQIEINNLNRTIKETESIIINEFYTSPNLNYNFDLVEKDSSRENIEALAKELMATEQLFNSIITLNKGNIDKSTWQGFIKDRVDNTSVNYILSLSGKSSLDEKDTDNLNKIRNIYNEFYANVANDTSIQGVNNINSLTSSYIQFISKISAFQLDLQ